ncbi:hypothetical protein CS063_02115 [Sporanaerobium hydrogeniformans]|uniref:Uncharacterized protein n=1 Tax=Sporanaerobium hydrogeniformans TaxID=3072179 RepID=A0AC61DHT8_9FIRM|nr:carbon-nitrogen hydrolase family protein [Sporanaerobium hydrogeniformans]PHV72293.1 hypothetical protein CS063_02115 [Sporanaerobium hydrogeniformans]
MKKQVVRLALLHMMPKIGNSSYNRQQLRRALAVAAGHEAQIALTPEMIEYGQLFDCYREREKVPVYPSRYLCDLGEVAYKYNMYFIVGILEREEPTGNLYNAVACINSQGHLEGTYRKMYTTQKEENLSILSGNELATFTWTENQLGLMVGEDVYLAKLPILLREMGAQLILGVVSPGVEGMAKEWCLRSAETRLPFIVCGGNLQGSKKNISYGESLVIRLGQVQYAFKSLEPTVFILDIELNTNNIELVVTTSLAMK